MDDSNGDNSLKSGAPTGGAQTGAPQLGVLFVHGIGHQQRGDTLPWAAEPLVQWLSDWLCRSEGENLSEDAQCRPYLDDARLSRPIPSEGDAPPHAHFHFQEPGNSTDPPQGEQRQHWILAESWWATEFTPPGYSDALPMALSVGPVLIEQIGPRIISDLLMIILGREAISKLAAGATGQRGNQRGAPWPLRVAVALISYPLILTLGLLAQTAMVALLVLGLIPSLGDPMLKLQLKLAGWLGDSYLMATSPVRLEAMASQIRRDIEWLASKDEDKGRCEAVAVIAHSGGAEVAYAALAEPQARPLKSSGPVLLITYGSAQSKTHLARQLDKGAEKSLHRMDPSWRFAASLAVLLALVLLLQESPPAPWVAGLLVFGYAVNIVIGLRNWWHVRNLRKNRPLRPKPPPDEEWVDYHAVADLVSDGIITDERECVRTRLVSNQHSIFRDHGGYWHNNEEFVVDMARLLYAKANRRELVANGLDRQILREGRLRRKDRVLRYLASGLLLSASFPVLWLGFGPLLTQYAGEPIRQFLVDLLTRANSTRANLAAGMGAGVAPADPIPGDLPTLFWANLLGGAALLAIAGLFTMLVLFPLWRQWSSAEEKAIFGRGRPREVGVRRRNFLLASVFAPTLAILTALMGTIAHLGFLSFLGDVNFGFPEGVHGLATFVVRVAHLLVGLDMSAVSVVFEVLFWAFVVLALIIFLTGVANALSSPSEDTGEPDVFDDVLGKLTGEK